MHQLLSEAKESIQKDVAVVIESHARGAIKAYSDAFSKEVERVTMQHLDKFGQGVQERSSKLCESAFAQFLRKADVEESLQRDFYAKVEGVVSSNAQTARLVNDFLELQASALCKSDAQGDAKDREGRMSKLAVAVRKVAQ